MARRSTKSSVKVNFKDVESRKTPPEGDYILEIVDAKLGKSNGGNEQFEFTLEIAKGEFKGTKVWFYCPIVENSLWKLFNFLEALGEEPPQDELEIDPSDLIGKKCVGVLTHDTYKGKKSAKMTDFDSVENYSGKDADEKGGKKKDKGKKDKDDSKSDKKKDKAGKDDDKKSSKKDKSEKEDKSSKKGGKDKDSGKKKPKVEKIDGDDLDDMSEKELQKLIDKHDLDVDLDDFKKLPKKVAAVKDALEEKDLLA